MQQISIAMQQISYYTGLLVITRAYLLPDGSCGTRALVITDTWTTFPHTITCYISPPLSLGMMYAELV